METSIAPVEFPELIIGIAGPIGVKIEDACDLISSLLTTMNYRSELIRLTGEMDRYEERQAISVSDDLYSQVNWKMDRANDLRERYDTAIMARIAIRTIRELRRAKTLNVNKPWASGAYVIRQLKHPDEVKLLRRVYGRQFILVSAYGSEAARKHELLKNIKYGLPTDTPETECENLAAKLISRDAKEDVENGQNLRDTYHLADVFIHGMNISHMESTLARFFQAFFGSNEITPSKDELGLYTAKSAALRSADLSRQVGAAVFTKEGELLVQGCNDVPKALGGNFWDGDVPDNRDIKRGFDPNENLKKEIVRNLVERLKDSGGLSPELSQLGSSNIIVEHLISKESGILSDAHIMDLTEYGRIVHAEMNALCDAARIGRAIKGSILYCTTFPCHNCAKHIIASGVEKVVFLEPYPKSKTYEMYAEEIEIENDENPKKVSFVPFIGISPFRYRDIFQKGKRKKDGKAVKWYYGSPKPMIEVEFPSYLQAAELWALGPLVGNFGE